MLNFSGHCLVMAIVNCNGDSFYAPSRAQAQGAVDLAMAAEEAGADIIDFGGESTRPGASYIDADEELRRVIPVIEAFRKRSRLPISVDTRKAVVARQCLEAGADIINDISALEDDKDMASFCAEKNATVVLMHKKGNPQDMQDAPHYDDVFSEVTAYLLSAAERALAAGISRESIILDPGFGFGKSGADNLCLLARLAEIRERGYPLLAGLSRKSFIGEMIGQDTNKVSDAFGRLAGTLAANAAAIMAGADIIRVHDVKEGADLVKVLYAVKRAG
ncbi:MAG: dihydropteroate synthase [Treponema sp.]|jgi:dihydropteroate synthase|nr:dihydropteroate synthase [Treponema sp.]